MTDRQISELSDRELEILRLVATGASNKEIAQQLSISTNTVKVHLRNIFSKIEVTSRTEAAMYSVRVGLVETAALGDASGSDEANSVQDGSALVLEGQPGLPGAARLLQDETNRRFLYLAAGVIALLAVLLVLVIVRPQGQQPAAAQSPIPSPTIRWVGKASLPTPRLAHALAAYENDIYAIGGQAEDGPTKRVEKYDPDTNRWSEVASKNIPVAQVGAAVVGGTIYVPGGCQEGDVPVDVLEAYDPRLDTWTEKASLPIGLCGYALAAFEGKIYLFGGWDGSAYLDRVFIYDPNQDEWMEGTNMQHPRAYAGAAVAGGKIYVFGGYNGEEALNYNEVYYPERDLDEENPWGEAASLPEGRYSSGVAALADTIYVFGGKAIAGGEIPSLVYLPLADEWQTIQALDLEDTSPGSISVGPFLYVIGGSIDGVPTGKNLAYQVVYTISIPIIVR